MEPYDEGVMWHHWGCRLRDKDLASHLVPYDTFYVTVWVYVYGFWRPSPRARA